MCPLSSTVVWHILKKRTAETTQGCHVRNAVDILLCNRQYWKQALLVLQLVHSHVTPPGYLVSSAIEGESQGTSEWQPGWSIIGVMSQKGQWPQHTVNMTPFKVRRYYNCVTNYIAFLWLQRKWIITIHWYQGTISKKSWFHWGVTDCFI